MYLCCLFTSLKIMSQSKSGTCTNSHYHLQTANSTSSFLLRWYAPTSCFSMISFSTHVVFTFLIYVTGQPTGVHFAPLPLHQHHPPLSISTEFQWCLHVSPPKKTKAHNQLHGTKFPMSLPLHVN
jgi:hypothetical protein